MSPAPRTTSRGGSGIPDGAIVGLLAFLLGTTVLFWSATALGGLLSHGRAPRPLPFLSTAAAIRHLATAPNDLAAAWPTTPRTELPSPVAFWTSFFALLALALTLLLTAATARARHRARLAEAREEREKWEERETPRQRRTADAPNDAAFADDRAQRAAPADTPRRAPVETVRTSPPPPAGTVPPGWAPMAADGRLAPGEDVTEVLPAWVPDQGGERQAPTAVAQPRAWRGGVPAGTLCVFAPEAGAGARRALVREVVAGARGESLVVVGADARLWQERAPHRRARRYDPQLLSSEDPENPRLRWAPHSGCEDPVVATARANALLLPTIRPAADAEEQGVRDLAAILLRCWLHAAALDGRPIRHVARWAAGGQGRQDAVAVLHTTDAHRAGEGWGGLLQAALLRPSATLDAALARVRAALGALDELHILTASTPTTPAETLDPAALLRGEPTDLYLLGHAGDARLREPGPAAGAQPHSAMPLLTALVDDLHARARHLAAHSTPARLDPPLLFVLDDVASVAPFPGLPELMARGGRAGLNALTLFRSPEQARARWGERAVHSLWTSADQRAVLGPLAAAPLAALLAAVGSVGALGAGDPATRSGLDADELLVLPDRQHDGPAQRFRIGPVPVGEA